MTVSPLVGAAVIDTVRQELDALYGPQVLRPQQLDLLAKEVA